jgi:predicted MFS family arabinose efflux permease
LQSDFRGIGRRKPYASWAAAFLCLSLLALLAVVQVAHMHPLDRDADHCSLCIAMHSAAPVAVMAAAVVLVRMGSSALVVEARPVVRHWHPKLYTRPPPTGV